MQKLIETHGNFDGGYHISMKMYNNAVCPNPRTQGFALVSGSLARCLARPKASTSVYITPLRYHKCDRRSARALRKARPCRFPHPLAVLNGRGVTGDVPLR